MLLQPDLVLQDGPYEQHTPGSGTSFAPQQSEIHTTPAVDVPTDHTPLDGAGKQIKSIKYKQMACIARNVTDRCYCHYEYFVIPVQ